MKNNTKRLLFVWSSHAVAVVVLSAIAGCSSSVFSYCVGLFVGSLVMWWNIP